MKIMIPDRKLQYLKEMGYPSVEEIVSKGLRHLTAGETKYNVRFMTPDGPRSYSVYKGKSFVHFNAEDIYSLVRVVDGDVYVEDLPDDLIEYLLKEYVVRDFSKIIQEADDAPVNLVNLLEAFRSRDEMAVCS